MADFQVKVTCRHCERSEAIVLAYSHYPVEKALEQLKGWERVALPYVGGQPILLCESCITLLKSWMAEFISTEPARAPRASITKPGDRIFIRDNNASWLVMALRRQQL